MLALQSCQQNHQVTTYRPHEHVRRLGVVVLEIPEVVMGCLGLGNLVVWLGFASMDDVGKLDGVLNEEHGNIVGDNIPVSFLCVELDRKTSHIANGISAATATEHCRKPDKNGRLARCVGKDWSKSDILGTLEELELAEGTAATGMDDALWDSFVVEPVDLARCQL